MLDGSQIQGTLPRPKNVPQARFLNGLSSPISRSNKNISKSQMGFGDIWCERWDSNPHGITTRTSNVLVYHSNTLANMLNYYNRTGWICQYLFVERRHRQVPSFLLFPLTVNA